MLPSLDLLRLQRVATRRNVQKAEVGEVTQKQKAEAKNVQKVEAKSVLILPKKQKLIVRMEGMTSSNPDERENLRTKLTKD